MVAVNPCASARPCEPGHAAHGAPRRGGLAEDAVGAVAEPEAHREGVFGAVLAVGDDRESRAHVGEVAEPGPNLVDDVGAGGAEPAAAGVGIEPPGRGAGLGVRDERYQLHEGDESDAPEPSIGDRRADDGAFGCESELVAEEVGNPRGLGGGQHRLGLAGVEREGLLTEDVLAGRHRRHRIDVRASEGGVEVGERERDVEALGSATSPFGVASDDAYDLEPRGAHRGDVDPASEAGADHDGSRPVQDRSSDSAGAPDGADGSDSDPRADPAGRRVETGAGVGRLDRSRLARRLAAGSGWRDPGGGRSSRPR